MTFLNPTALLALLAAGIPVILHFLNLRRQNKIQFSSIEFILRLRKNKIRRIKIRQWILLALRILIIASLVFAFSRPALKSASFFSAGAKTSVVIIIDNSFSMAPVTAGGSYFNIARKGAAELLNTFKSGDEAAVLLTCGENSGGGFTNDFYKVKNIIDNALITDNSVPLISSIETAASLLSASSNANREIYIFSDFQKSCILPDNYSSSENLKSLNERINIYYIAPETKKETNLSITGLASENSLIEPGKRVSFYAIVSNFSGAPAAGTSVSLYINGRRAAQQGISIGIGESKKILFETTLDETGLLEISAGLEEDDIPNDNYSFLSLFVPEKINIAAFADNPDDLKYFMTAIESFESESIEISIKNSAMIPSSRLDKYDLVVYCGGGDQAARLADYYSGGGSVLLFPSSASSIDDFNRISSALNLPRAEKFVTGLNERNFRIIDKADFTHPILSGLFEKKESRLSYSPSIYSYFSSNRETGRIIFTLSGGSPFFTEYNSGRGKLFRFYSAPVPGASDFPSRALFAPLMRSCISYLAVKRQAEENLFAGDAISVQGGGNITVHLPGGQKAVINNAGGRFLFTNTGAAGTYKFYSGGKLIEFSSLNFDSKESVLEKWEFGGFRSLLSSLNAEASLIQIDPSNNLEAEIEKSRFGTELWIHFLILALVLAAAEMLTAASLKNESADLEKI